MEKKGNFNKIIEIPAKIVKHPFFRYVFLILVFVALYLLYHESKIEFKDIVTNYVAIVSVTIAYYMYANFRKGNILNQWINAQTSPDYYKNSFLVEKLINKFEDDDDGLINQIRYHEPTQKAVDFILDYFILKATGVKEKIFDQDLTIKLGKCDTIFFFSGLRPWIEDREKRFPCKKNEFNDLKWFYEKCMGDQYLFCWDDIPKIDSSKLIGFLEKKYKIYFVKNEICIFNWSKTIEVSDNTNYISITRKKLNNEKFEVTVKINYEGTDKLIGKIENNELYIYGYH